MPLSVSDLKRTGDPFPIQRGASLPSSAADGTLVYLGTTGGLEQLIWKNRKGVKLGAVGQSQTRLRAPRLSPDASRIAALGWDDSPQLDIWIHDVTRGSKTRFTSHPASEDNALWTPQGNMMTFTSERNGNADIFIQSADGSGEPKPLVATPHNDFGNDCTTQTFRQMDGSLPIRRTTPVGTRFMYDAFPMARGRGRCR